MRRAGVRSTVVTWLVTSCLAIAAGVGVVLALNATTFGSAAFVRIYLEAVGRGDATAALALPGVTAGTDLRIDLLTDEALAGFTALDLLSVAPGDDGTEVVTFAWVSAEGPGQASFTVERTGTRLGLFPEWAFAVSPVATLSLIVEHDERFTANGMSAVTGVAAPDPVAYAVLVPGAYRIDHSSTYLRADAVTVIADRPGSEIAAGLDVQPATTFVARVTSEVRDQLDACAGQDVLFPTGCPLGQAVANRVASTPEWSIVAYPAPTIEPGAEFGTWFVPDATLTARLVVDIQDLYDGSITRFDQELGFSARYLVTIGADDATVQVVPLLDE